MSPFPNIDQSKLQQPLELKIDNSQLPPPISFVLNSKKDEFNKSSTSTSHLPSAPLLPAISQKVVIEEPKVIELVEKPEDMPSPPKRKIDPPKIVKAETINEKKPKVSGDINSDSTKVNVSKKSEVSNRQSFESKTKIPAPKKKTETTPKLFNPTSSHTFNVITEKPKDPALNQLLGILNNYWLKRKNKDEYLVSFFCIGFGKSKTQKKDALNAIKLALVNRDGQGLNDHLSTLRNGDLGHEIRTFLKATDTTSFLGKNIDTVSELVELLAKRTPSLNSPIL